MSFKITAESDMWESRGTFTLALHCSISSGDGSTAATKTQHTAAAVFQGIPATKFIATNLFAFKNEDILVLKYQRYTYFDRRYNFPQCNGRKKDEERRQDKGRRTSSNRVPSFC
jgi:hypothetical protein